MQSLAATRIVDPILSEHARGYTQVGFVGDHIFPIVNMPSRAAKRIEFGREAFKRYNIRRAPGARFAEVSFGYEGKPVQLIQRALSAKTPYEHVDEASAPTGPGIDLIQGDVDLVMSVVSLDREINQAEVARTAASYAAANKLALVGAAKWSADTSTPQKDMKTAKEAIRAKTGKRGNVLLLSATSAEALRVHQDVKGHFKYVTEPDISDSMLASYFGVEKVVVGEAIYDDDAGATVDVWGNDAILAYVPPVGQRNMKLPGYGYTYRLLGHPFVEQTYWDRDVASWRSPVTDEWSAEMVGPDAGYLFQNTI